VIVTVAREARFDVTADGRVWTNDVDEAGYWTEYLTVFSRVDVLCRTRSVERPETSAREASAPGVTFIRLPDYRGLFRFLRVAGRAWRVVRDAARTDGAFIVRAPGLVGFLLVGRLRRTRMPYGLEVVGDPAGVFARGGPGGPVRPALRFVFTAWLRRASRGASAVDYVSRRALQVRYPPRDGAPTFDYPNAELDEAAFTVRSRRSRPKHEAIPSRLVTVGSLAQPYKGVDTVIRAVAECRRAGIDVRFTVIGDGAFRRKLERLASRLGLDAVVVEFAGKLPGPGAVRARVVQADLFVLASTTEGFPRALLEAMAAGLPCLGTAVGGIPDVLAAEDLFPPRDPAALASLIVDVLADPARLERMASRNRERARDFRLERVRAMRRTFWAEVKAATAAHTGEAVEAR
jgi:phosphatidylinositol alpha-1,6-mannosyltransferase